jgi:serine/threonine protein kinase
LINEAKAGKSLSHPNLLPLLQYFEDDTYFYLVFPYKDGAIDLLKVMEGRSHSPLPENIVSQIMKQLFSVVQYCHANGAIWTEGCTYVARHRPHGHQA